MLFKTVWQPCMRGGVVLPELPERAEVAGLPAGDGLGGLLKRVSGARR